MASLYAVTNQTGYIWNEWNSRFDTTGSATSETSATIITTDTFAYWVSDSTTNASTSSGYIYATWIDEYTNNVHVRQETEQQRIRRIAEQERERQHFALEREKRRQRNLLANETARKLLVSNLNPQQRKEFEDNGHFFVTSPSGKLYRIREGRSINIDLMAGNNREIVKQRLCAHPQIACPDNDTMLTQKIMLEHQEQDFLRIARTYEPLH
jgi:acetyl/propionyl-CoA carboxylase alpha subunit